MCFFCVEEKFSITAQVLDDVADRHVLLRFQHRSDLSNDGLFFSGCKKSPHLIIPWGERRKERMCFLLVPNTRHTLHQRRKSKWKKSKRERERGNKSKASLSFSLPSSLSLSFTLSSFPCIEASSSQVEGTASSAMSLPLALSTLTLTLAITYSLRQQTRSPGNAGVGVGRRCTQSARHCSNYCCQIVFFYQTCTKKTYHQRRYRSVIRVNFGREGGMRPELSY